jgi:CubicO group peptidase (beta-lactamase class C family)
MLTAAPAARAHRLDEYLQATRLAIDTHRVDLEIDLTPGVAVASKVLSWIDRDGNNEISPAEGDAYARQMLRAVTLSVDGSPARIELMETRFPQTDDMNQGVGTIRLRASATVPAMGAGRHRIQFLNAHRSELSVYLVNALAPADRRIRIEDQRRDRAQHSLTLDYTVEGETPPLRILTFIGALILVARLVLLSRYKIRGMKIAGIALLLGIGISAFGADKSGDPAVAGMDAERLARIPARMKEFVDAGKAAGIVTLVARHGKIASVDAVGYRELESKSPMTVDTIFRIASLTKPVTCAGIMALVDDGRISVLDPVEKYLPEFKGQKVNGCAAGSGYDCAARTPTRPVDILDLMTHTSGLPGAAPAGRGGAPATLAEAVVPGGRLTLLFEPGTAWNYSNIGYEALGRIIEVVSHEPYDRFLEERIFAPLRMSDTFFFVSADKQNRVAAVYTDEGGSLKRAASVETAPKFPAPQGGLLSTATDLFRFNQMMLNKGKLDGHRVLSAAAVELMTTSLTGDIKAGFAPGVGHGLGYEVVRDARGTFRYNSIGSFVKGGAYRTYEFVDPAKDLVGVILLQRTNGGGDVADEINVFAAMAAAAIER